jgi:hypothetical protein
MSTGLLCVYDTVALNALPNALPNDLQYQILRDVHPHDPHDPMDVSNPAISITSYEITPQSHGLDLLWFGQGMITSNTGPSLYAL